MNPWAIVRAFVLSAALLAGGYAKGWSDNEAKHTKLENKALEDALERNRKGAEQHENDQLAINTLRNKLDGMRVHIPKNISGCGKDGGAGLLYDRVDEELGRLQARAGELFQRCDQLNIDTIRLNTECATAESD